MSISRFTRGSLWQAGLMTVACLLSPAVVRSQNYPAPLPQSPQAIPGPGAYTGLPTAPMVPAYTADSAAPAAPAKAADPAFVKAVQDAMKQIEADKKKADDAKKKDDEAKGYEVGSNLNIKPRFDNRGFLMFETENKDFKVHVGMLLNFDSVWFVQPGLAAGPGGTGTLVDGSSFRRARVKFDGVLWENFDFNFVPTFEGQNIGLFDHMWVGVNSLPILGSVQIGQHKIWQGLESISRNEDLPLMERSPLFDGIWNEFGLGVFQTRNLADDRMTVSTSIHRPAIYAGAPNGAIYSFTNWAESARVTGLPIYEDDGRCLLHLGASYHFRTGSDSASINGPPEPGTPAGIAPNVVRFRTRVDIRDAVGVGPPGFVQPGTNVWQGNNSRILDTGNILANNDHTFATEIYGVRGPLYFMNEATFVDVPNAIVPASPAGTNRGSLYYWGTYSQVGYFLTGENRPYNKRYGYYDKLIPRNNFFWVKGEDGERHHGIGAWEVIYRYSFLDLSQGNQSVGGATAGYLNEHTVGLSWYWNPNMRLMLNYTNANRLSDPTPAGAPGNSGRVQGLGVRLFMEM